MRGLDMEWLEKEFKAIRTSKTVQFAYAKKLAGLVSVLLALSGYFESSIDPMWFGAGVALLGMIDNKLRKVTRKPLEEK